MHQVYYVVNDVQDFVEVTLFVERNGVVVVAQEEGSFDTMEDAQPMIQHLKNLGCEIEYKSSGTQVE